MGSMIGKYVVAKYVFFPPTPPSYSESKPFNVTWIQTANDKRISAYYLKSDKRDEKLHVLYSHGNAADIGLMFDFLALLRDELHVNVLAYDYLGYGLSSETATPNETNCYLSIDAAYHYLVDKEGVSPHDIIIFGTSLGTGVSSYLATKYKNQFRGLILESPFMSVVRVVSENSLGRLVDLFDSYKRISDVTCPVFIIHGGQDRVVPFEHGRRLYEKIPKQYQYPPCWVESAGHDDIIPQLNVRNYLRKLNEFLRKTSEIQQQQNLSS